MGRGTPSECRSSRGDLRARAMQARTRRSGSVRAGTRLWPGSACGVGIIGLRDRSLRRFVVLQIAATTGGKPEQCQHGSNAGESAQFMRELTGR